MGASIMMPGRISGSCFSSTFDLPAFDSMVGEGGSSSGRSTWTIQRLMWQRGYDLVYNYKVMVQLRAIRGVPKILRSMYVLCWLWLASREYLA